MRFEAKKDFWCEELQSQYVNGERYRVRPGNDRLAGLARQWEREGRIRFLRPEEIGTSVSGGSEPRRRTFFERITSWFFRSN